MSDRKESENVNQNEVKKYCLSENNNVFLALAGDAYVAKSIFNRLIRSDVNSSNVVGSMQDFIRAHYFDVQYEYRVDGFLVVKDQNAFRLYTVDVLNDRLMLSEDDPSFAAHGDPHARLIFRYLAEKKDFGEFPCELVAEWLCAFMSDIAKYVESVGEPERFGFDIITFANTGEIRQRKRVSAVGVRLVISLKSGSGKVRKGGKRDA